jgi:hypothetical protein
MDLIGERSGQVLLQSSVVACEPISPTGIDELLNACNAMECLGIDSDIDLAAYGRISGCFFSMLLQHL